MYRGDQAIEGASEFISYLKAYDIPHLFVTNNSSASQIDVARKLNQMNIQVNPEQILTSAIATAQYIADETPAAKVFHIGEKGLEDALKASGCIFTNDQADYVVMGIDREISYQKIEKASLLIQRGATFLSTNKDPAIPKERGLLPGNGALTAALATASGKEPVFIGKPEKVMMDIALKQVNLKADEVLMVGDNYLTDIQAGIQSNIDTLMVLTGYSSRESIKKYPDQPTFICDNLNRWLEESESIQNR